MVNYPDLSNLNNASGISGFMSLPNSSYPYFWIWILATIWIIITSTIYFKERERLGKAKLLSTMSVAALVVLVLATIGSIFSIITSDILTYIFVFSAVIWAIWFFSTRD